MKIQTYFPRETFAKAKRAMVVMGFRRSGEPAATKELALDGAYEYPAPKMHVLQHPNGIKEEVEMVGQAVYEGPDKGRLYHAVAVARYGSNQVFWVGDGVL